jgi:L-amino acid N-acyltransferase YncA
MFARGGNASQVTFPLILRRRVMTSLSVVIRPATASDAERIGAVQVEAWSSTYAGIVEHDFIDALSASKQSAMWARRLSGVGPPSPNTFVAESAEGLMVGFASGGAIREPHAGFDGELHAIYLLRPAQRQRVGTRLVKAWGSAAAESGLHSAVVRVLAENTARQFYESLDARPLKEGEVALGGKSYNEVWYGWDDLGALAA